MDFSRKAMVFSVSVLGISLMTFLFAYMVYGDSTDEDLRTLRQTNIIFRHGMKFPDRIYQKDLHVHDVLNIDPGSLSHPGSLQMYNLGKSMKHRYLKLIPQDGFYTKKKIQVKSSSHERTIMSALSFLAGFMPPLEAQNPLPILWQPIPVIPIERERDDIIAQKRTCKRYDEVLKSRMNSREIQKIDKENADLYKLLSKHTGDNISSISAVEMLHNTLEAEKMAGWSMPDWSENIFPEKTQPLAEKYLQLLTDTPFMKRIRGGPLIHEIIDTMTEFHVKKIERTISVYSGHDVTLVNVMNAMNIINQTTAKPEYSAALAFELHQSLDDEKRMVVKLYYYKDAGDKYPTAITIPDCSEPCHLDDFQKKMRYLKIDDFEEMCKTF